MQKQNNAKKTNRKSVKSSSVNSKVKANRYVEQKALKTNDSALSETINTTQPDILTAAETAEKAKKTDVSTETGNQTGASEKLSIVLEAVVQAPEKLHKKINIPNMLTLFRIWAIPAIVFTFFFTTPMMAWIGVALFILAAVSDYMDGYLARHLNQLSRFGRVLDPIADKLLIGSILLMLAFTARLGDYGIIPAVVILCREILVSGLREFLAEIKVGCPVTRLAKWKTACQMTALPMLMVCEPDFSGFLSDVFYYVGHFALWGAALLTVMTGYDYWKSGRKYMDD